MPLEGDTTRFDRDYSTYTLSAQIKPPSCVAPPPACTLELTGSTTVVNVTLRGDSDGTITVYWSGSTGTTSCYINGVLDGTEVGNSYTFTGLSAGYYNILIEEGSCFDTVDNIQVLDGEFRTGNFFVNTPASLTAAENPIILNLKTARNTQVGGTSYSQFDIDVDSTVADGTSIVFTFTYPQAYTAVFYAKNFPNRNNYFLASVLKDSAGNTVGSNTATEIATSIAEVLQNDSVISRLYWIRAESNVVTLTAKEANTKLDADTVLSISNTSINYSIITNGNAAYDGSITENYSLYADILVNTNLQYGENPSTFTFNKAAQLELPFNQVSNQHFFDLSEVLKNFVYTPKIDFTLTGFTTISNMLCGYKVQYGEKYPLVPNSTTKKSRVKGTTSTLYTLNSALQWEEDNDLTSYLGTNLHNLNPAFDGTWQLDTPTSVDDNLATLTITDYLYDTGVTATTNIKFRVEDEYNMVAYDWQSSPVFVLTGTTSYPQGGTGQIFVSGETSGASVQYSRQFYFWNAFDTADIQGGQTALNVKTGVQFLTNAPNPKFVQRNSSEFLYVMLPKDYGKTLKIIADLYFYDGTSLLDEELYTVSTSATNYGGVYCFAAGYNELNLASYETYSGGTRKIRRVDFALHQQDVTGEPYNMSETRSYRYEIDEQSRRYGVAFLNKLGTYDIFDFSGEIVDSVTHENEQYEVPREIGLAGNSPFGFQSTSVYNTKIVKTIAANTGWIDEDHFDWLMELLSSNRCYNYTETDQSFLIVESAAYEKSSNDDLYQIDVQFKETLYQNNISV